MARQEQRGVHQERGSQAVNHLFHAAFVNTHDTDHEQQAYNQYFLFTLELHLTHNKYNKHNKHNDTRDAVKAKLFTTSALAITISLKPLQISRRPDG